MALPDGCSARKNTGNKKAVPGSHAQAAFSLRSIRILLSFFQKSVLSDSGNYSLRESSTSRASKYL